MNPCRALIVDDERLARRELRYLLGEHPTVEIVGEARTIDEAAELVSRMHPDLLFLDVRMGGETGFDLFERTRVEARVVFVTAHDEFAVRAFEVNALDYLVKPVNPLRLGQAIERALACFPDRRPAAPPCRLAYDDAVFVCIDQAPRFVKLASIVCIDAVSDYTRLTGVDGPLGLVLKPLKHWEALLPTRQFCRIRRSTIINCEHVVRFEPWFNSTYQVHLAHVREPVTMSRRQAKLFRQRFAL